MKLTSVRITNFRSIQDSTEFQIGDVTCLVGKNESGKTALLQALYRLNPIVDKDDSFDVTEDYPRRAVSDYNDDIDAGRRQPARVVQATYSLEREDIAAVKDAFGSECLKSKNPTVTLNKSYPEKRSFSGLNVNFASVLKHLVKTSDLEQSLTTRLLKTKSVEKMIEILSGTEKSSAVQKLTEIFREISKHDISYIVYNRVLRHRITKFLYFDEYYQMKGRDNVDTLQQRVMNNALEDSDHPLLGLIALAGLDLDQLTNPQKTEALIAKLEAAENRLTGKVLSYWSQNRHLRMKFDIRTAQPNDPEDMTSGMNVWGRVHDTKHGVSTNLGTRSRGFIWFFSFLAWYSQLRKQDTNMILLLDEPGLSLHAKAQGDLLRYFEEDLKPYYQLIYTTHSPFLVDAAHFDRVRIVQDLSIESGSDDLTEEQQGTQVITEVLDATPDSLFPLQGALGYDISQTLFIGLNNLVVEGVSDLLYIQIMSAFLQEKGESGLDSKWTITPVGGFDKIPTFVALIAARTNLNLAILTDFQKKDQQKIENLFQKKLLKRSNILTYSDFTSGNEADIEDMFAEKFYMKLVNGAFGSSISLTDLPGKQLRIVRRLEQYMTGNSLPRNAQFNHYRPARYFNDNADSLVKDLDDSVFDRFRRMFSTLNALLQ